MGQYPGMRGKQQPKTTETRISFTFSREGAPSGMDAYQLRVIEEKSELDAKRESLRVFFDSEKYRTLPSDEQTRLMRQFAYMANYSDVLGERIAAF